MRGRMKVMHPTEVNLIQEIYEPEHERGVTCWCRPKSIVKRAEHHIVHNEERARIPKLVNDVLDDVLEWASNADEDDRYIEGMYKAIEMAQRKLGLDKLNEA